MVVTTSRRDRLLVRTILLTVRRYLLPVVCRAHCLRLRDGPADGADGLRCWLRLPGRYVEPAAPSVRIPAGQAWSPHPLRWVYGEHTCPPAPAPERETRRHSAPVRIRIRIRIRI